MKKKFLLLLFTAILLLTACGEPAAQSKNTLSSSKKQTDLEKVQLFLAADGTAMYYAYVARANGYFQDEGLAVELVSGKNGALVVDKIGNETPDVGIVGVPSLLPAWNEKMDIQVVYQINSTNLFDFIVPKKSKISNISQLKGKTIGVTDLGGAEVPMVRSIVAGAGLKADQDVAISPIGNNATSIRSAFDKGEIAAFSGGAHDLYSLYAMGFERKSLLPKEYKTLPSTAIIANGKTIKERPELIEKITRAITRGVDFSIKNRNATYDIMKEVAPQEYTDETAGKLFLDTFINLSAPIETDKGYGYIYRDSWKKLIQQLSVGEESFVANEIDLDQYLNTSFLKKANQFEK